MSDGRYRPGSCSSVVAAAMLILGLVWGPSARGGAEQERAQITPNSIRVQPLDEDGEGGWITLPGYAEIGSPTPSPDGQWIAFDAYKQGYNHSGAECWIARRDGTEQIRLTAGATPRWSPDGRRLLFMRDDLNLRDMEPGIFVINRDGTRERRIGEGRRPDWSPDGRSIVFATGGHRGRWGGSRIMSVVCIARADGSEREVIAAGDAPTWSPDGQRIACIMQDPALAAPMIRVVELKGGQQLFVGYGWFRANWSPDGRLLACNGPVDEGRAGMVRYAPEAGDRPEALFPEFERGTSPCYSADGRFLVFIARRPEPAPDAGRPGADRDAGKPADP